MADTGMQWIRVDADAERHPKVRRLSARLKNPDAFIYVVRLWTYVGEWYPADGRITDPADVLEQAWNFRGESGALISAMVEERILDRDGDALIVHGWDEINGPTFKKMEEDRARKKAARDHHEGSRERKPRKRRTDARPPVPPSQAEGPSQPDGRSTDAPSLGAAGVEKEGNGEGEEQGEVSAPSAPQSLSSPEFIATPSVEPPNQRTAEAEVYCKAYREKYAQKADLSHGALKAFSKARGKYDLPQLLNALDGLAHDQQFGFRLGLQATLHENNIQQGLLMARPPKRGPTRSSPRDDLNAAITSGGHAEVGSRRGLRR